MRIQVIALFTLIQYIFCQELCPCNSFDTIERECIIYNRQLTCNPQKRIIGGTPADLLQWPYIISLQIASVAKGPGCYSHFCAGALVAPNLVLSAAHCYDTYMRGMIEGPLRFKAYAAQTPSCRHLGNSRGKFGFRSQVDKVYILPEWNRATASGDLAILVLNESLPGPYVNLQSEFFEPQITQDVTIAGYGSVNPEENANKKLFSMRQLYETKLSYINGNLCSFFVEQFQAGAGSRLNSSTMVCAYNQAADSCKGDSGGPAVLKGATPGQDVLIGITSWGPFSQCTSEDRGQAPGIFARVSVFKPWIDSIIAKYSQGMIDEIEDASVENPLATTGDVVLKPSIPEFGN